MQKIADNQTALPAVRSCWTILLYSVLNLNYTLKLYRACWQMSSWQVVLYFFLVTKSTYQEQPVRIILDNTLAYMVLQPERYYMYVQSSTNSEF